MDLKKTSLEIKTITTEATKPNRQDRVDPVTEDKRIKRWFWGLYCAQRWEKKIRNKRAIKRDGELATRL